MTNIKSITRAKSSLEKEEEEEEEEKGDEEDEEEEKKEKEKKKSKSQQDEVSLLECMNADNGNDSAKPSPEMNGGLETDFSHIANSEIKKAFLLTSDEDSRSSESEETPEKQEESEKKEPKQTQERKEKKKNDLSEFRIPNLNANDDNSDKEDQSSANSLTEESESSKDSEDSVLCVQEVKKRKREQIYNTEDSDSSSDIEQVYCKTESSPAKGRKNIKKILKKENLQGETKQALRVETERKKRVSERQKLFDKLFPCTLDSKLILDFDPETKRELVVVDPKLAKQLKPHQRDGVRFMWNCCFESLKRLEEDSGSGCVLAHCMGLGKTLQVITLVHTVLTHNTGVHTVMIMCPLNTIRNWIHEFKTWQKDCDEKVQTFEIPFRSKINRIRRVNAWSRDGGVLMISYEMFRNLLKTDGRAQVFSKGFLDPGPDLVICDEGHILKNNNSALSKRMSGIRSLRRIILTGTPLQNNLMEYYCMVQFVKPNILGTSREFKNRFVHPINNGQFEDSTQQDVRLMKRRSHVLHTMLEGFVQRFSYHVLTPFLPEKYEYAISIALTETQGNTYKLFIERSTQENRALLKDFHSLQKVWTHPRALLLHAKKKTVEDCSWVKDIPEKELEDVSGSGKLLLLFDILRRCKEIGDKVLVFSQSLYSLDIIEFFLQKANAQFLSGVQTEFADSWVYGKDYSRLDGSTSSDTRDLYCQKFNSPDSDRFRLFLISTRAGGLGINLVAANRVVVFDASWNPTHDVQSIFRVYRFGQKKPCFIYRFLAAATMEEKIYRRQVTKLSLAHRILDEHQIERHYTMVNLQELYTYDPIPKSEWKSPKIPKDNLFAEVLAKGRDFIVGYHEHDSLLENKEEEELTEEERRAAWEDYEKEKLTVEYPKNGFPIPLPLSLEGVNMEGLNAVYRYTQGNPAFQNAQESPAFQNAQVSQTDNQMCKIVDVRTLKIEEAVGRNKLIQFGKALGLRPYNDENLEKYCRRIEQELKKIFPWGIPPGGKSVVSNAN